MRKVKAWLQKNSNTALFNNKNNKLQVRLAAKVDIDNIYKWRNNPLIRQNSVNPKIISLAEHEKWFEECLNRSNNIILIGEINSMPVGVVRFEIEKNKAEVSIYLVPDSGVRGCGFYLLSQAETWLKMHIENVKYLNAKVLQNNEPSNKLFVKLNYISQLSKFGYLKYSKNVGT
jgi:UDP-2,4-diacetamido-2,4,6-trideoxy-beta-L-altropyranose hydrolase